MFEHFKEYPIEGVKYIVLIILAVIVWILYRRTKSGDGSVFGNSKSEKMLKNEFAVIDETTFDEDKDDYRLIVGMCMRTQTQLEKEKSPNEAFLQMSEVKRNVMVLGYLFEDSRTVVSNFFRSNGEPLLSASVKAAEDVVGGDFANIIKRDFNMFDENNESVSVDENIVNSLNAEFKALMEKDGTAIYKAVADYIRKNKTEYLS